MRHFKIKTDLTARTANNESEHTEKKKKNKIRTERNLSVYVALCRIMCECARLQRGHIR